MEQLLDKLPLVKSDYPAERRKHPRFDAKGVNLMAQVVDPLYIQVVNYSMDGMAFFSTFDHPLGYLTRIFLNGHTFTLLLTQSREPGILNGLRGHTYHGQFKDDADHIGFRVLVIAHLEKMGISVDSVN